MKKLDTFFINAEMLGDLYEKEYLRKYKKEDLENNWWEGTKFIISKAFYRGRKDKLSKRYETYAFKRLEEYFEIKSNASKITFESFKTNYERNFTIDISDIKKKINTGISNVANREKNPDIFNKFSEYCKNNNAHIIPFLLEPITVTYEFNGKDITENNVYMNNEKDLRMLLSFFKYILQDDRRLNLYKYILQKIEDNIGVIYDELNRIDFVGDKVSCLILRDVMMISGFNRNNVIDISNQEFIFPIDTWISQIYDVLWREEGLSLGKEEDLSLEKKRENIISACGNKYDICKVAAGMWYLGPHSLELIIQQMKFSELQLTTNGL